MTQTRIVIVGGGFGGLAAAKTLRNTPAQVIITGEAGLFYAAGALVLSLIFLCYSARFAFRRSAVTARQLLAASIIYLPALFILLMLSGK